MCFSSFLVLSKQITRRYPQACWRQLQQGQEDRRADRHIGRAGIIRPGDVAGGHAGGGGFAGCDDKKTGRAGKAAVVVYRKK
jgi:hypothetical protein